MASETDTPSTPPSTPEAGARSVWSGRSELVMAVLVLGVAVYLTFGIATMTVPEGAEAPGPKFFPTLLVGVLYALAVLLVVQHFRSPVDPRPGTEGADQVASNWRALGTVLIAFAGFAAILRPVGWILSATVLFWLVARALGSRRFLFDIGLALVFASLIQVAFSAGLGLSLPAGFLEGVL